MVRAIESGEVGIGQLFRHLNALPKFQLLSAEKKKIEKNSNNNNTGGGDGDVLCREYVLSCDELRCQFYEEFVSDLWELGRGENA